MKHGISYKNSTPPTPNEKPMTSTIAKAYQPPAEDMYPATIMPAKVQANASGEVLWFAEGFGWYVGGFASPHMPNTTYWTYVPDRPACENSNALRDSEFDRWMLTFSRETREALRDTLSTAFHAGWRLGRQPNVNH